MMWRKGAGFLLLAFLAASCENVDLDLHDQITFKHQEYPMIPPPKGSVSMNAKRVDYSTVDAVMVTSPVKRTKETVEDGKKLYDTFCIACHGPDGTTTGAPVADKFDPRPANLKNETALALTEGEIFQRIVVDGMGVMPGYKFEMSDEEAWKVVSYVMQLQGRK